MQYDKGKAISYTERTIAIRIDLLEDLIQSKTRQ